MLQAYLPLLILLAISVVNALVMVGASTFLSPGRQTAVKAAPYDPVWTRWEVPGSGSV